jgi:hypothetical protein
MKSAKAIAVLAVPFAATALVLVGGMCLTPYWDCKFHSTSIANLWVPVLLALVAFSVVAAIVLFIDLLVIQRVLSRNGSHRLVIIAVLGAVIAMIPRMIVAAAGGQGIGALSPQLEFVPFGIAGAVFALVLDRLIKSNQ